MEPARGGTAAAPPDGGTLAKGGKRPGQGKDAPVKEAVGVLPGDIAFGPGKPAGKFGSVQDSYAFAPASFLRRLRSLNRITRMATPATAETM